MSRRAFCVGFDLFRDAVPVPGPLASPCMIWRHAKLAVGYGRVRLRRGVPRVYAHRAAWESVHGPLPAGLVIDHLCRVKSCVNPEHLEAVPHSVNSLRGRGAPALNARKVACKRGHDFDEANTYISRRGERVCRACHRAAESARRHAHRLASLR